MMTEKEYRQMQLQKEAQQQSAQRRLQGEPEPERVYVYKPPLPANATSRQKLEAANSGFERLDVYKEPPMTDSERGMSEMVFNTLSPQRRNEIVNRVNFERRMRLSK